MAHQYDKTRSDSVRSENVSQFRAKKSIAEIIDLCENIKSIEAGLRANLSMIPEEFDRSLNEIKDAKDRIERAMRTLTDPNLISLLKKRAIERGKKRTRLKRRKVKNKLEAAERKKRIESELNEINEKIKLRLAEEDIKQKNEEYKKNMDSVLKDVNKRKAEAKRYLLLIEELKKLRDAREKSSLGRGENVYVSEKQTFFTNIEKLKLLWESALNKYMTEEFNLKERLLEDVHDKTILKDVSTNSLAQNSSSFGNEWMRVMFGERHVRPQSEVCKSLDRFICVRKQWDQFVCFDGGTKIPVEWIIPPIPSEEWKDYVKTCKDDD